MKTATTFFSIFFWTLYAVFICANILTSASNYQTTSLPFKSFIVKSGSMEPTIMTGDVIAIRSQPSYGINDIVTFTDAEDRIITHRISKIVQTEKKKTFETKGDNNKTTDPEAILPESILGKYSFRIPYLGFILVYSQTPVGYFLVISIPVVMIIASELFSEKSKQVPVS